MRIYYRSATGQVEPFFERADRWQLHESPQIKEELEPTERKGTENAVVRLLSC